MRRPRMLSAREGFIAGVTFTNGFLEVQKWLAFTISPTPIEGVVDTLSFPPPFKCPSVFIQVSNEISRSKRCLRECVIYLP